MKGLIFVIYFCTVSILSGCATQLENQVTASEPLKISFPKINHRLYDPSHIDIPSEASIFSLSEDQQQTFLRYYKQQLSAGEAPHKALANFLSYTLSNFTYYGETTTAEQSMRFGKGNCMSLAILTTALAQLVNLKVDYRDVETIPIFEKKNNILLSSKHVQAIIYDPRFVEDNNLLYLVKPAIVIDYFPSASNRVVSGIVKSSLIARFYINIAAKYLANNDINSAFVFANKAYEIDNKPVDIVNLLGVIHRRAGDEISAENFYRFGLSKQADNINLLKNYLLLLSEQGRLNEVALFEQRIAKLYDPNPYNWLKEAYIAQQQNQLRKAEKYYLKTIDNAPYLQEAYLGLYQVYLHKGNKLKAISIIEQALPWTHDHANKQRYHAKLFSLTGCDYKIIMDENINC